ncbi:rhodanese-like domain-containing protein [Patescibacteria group bacterium]|nr:rhodanese-like domain-containing protein [Patescibacteria group bacterium]
MADITPQKLKEEIDKGTVMTIVDLQTPEKYEHNHIPGAINVPFEVFPAKYAELLKDKDEVIILHGEFDELGKGGQAVDVLQSDGYTKVGRIVGGLMGWRNAGYPTDSGIES